MYFWLEFYEKYIYLGWIEIFHELKIAQFKSFRSIL